MGRKSVFAVEEGHVLSFGRLVYVRQDYALNFVPRQQSDCSVEILHVELGFSWVYGDTKYANQVSGYCGDSTRWDKRQLRVPNFHSGRLILLDEAIECGDIIGLEGSESWDISYDSATSWVCFGDVSSHKDDVAVLFAMGCGAILRANQLKALWVKPIFQ
ncbi:hypothetical protein [Dictyobacter halimunensis]|uniref:hypothetical protein n=1 Tax=Dictyobacter halimunensis TaxID=3026934 RepID=UPI0030C6E9A5